MRQLPPFPDLRSFLHWLDQRGDLLTVKDPADLRHEMTALQLAALRAAGPALRFDHAHSGGTRADLPVIANLFGTRERVAAGLGMTLDDLPKLGEFLAALRSPAPVDGMRDALSRWPLLRAALTARPQIRRSAPVQQAQDIADLTQIPVQTPWPRDAGPLITWPVVITRPYGTQADQITRYNLGVYRAQVLGPDRLIMRWLAHRGGAAHARTWAQARDPMPVAIALGADPATLLSAALPLPETVSELGFSGVLRGARTELVAAKSVPLMVPAQAEIILEGWIHPDDSAPEGPFGDHTGYYNAVENFPVMRISAITHRRDPMYLTTVTGRPPDEPSVIGEVFNDLALPVIRAQIPEIRDLWLPPAGCSYRIAVVQIDKRYPGQARRVMMALWGMLPQFSYTKLVIVVDTDIDPRNWDDIAWALSTRMDPSRDLMVLDRTPMDYLDFASPLEGLAGKLGVDATNKIGAETTRDWGEVMTLDPAHEARAAEFVAQHISKARQ
ncbi:UbiD family decarboxylase [Roseinatronobacter bogoriensis]|uniref:UbiD family decarboxylase n=1 Tax=Roseinatronobacter bogoriensis subsp. barguzinensis TaxID=441209 RepID=A0A2K8KMG2_9RHOB|nr:MULTISPECIES: UbiD family decarboxylase [Rhodobaca]ATX67750.1 UbiD family decarboxylase [Rhodobaca barguzinensis]MBB4208306.1 4-hydroxy-3-polyprenylbenzoate decarboxylase [Rhodobaca bogoriensis DSM 18756]TDW38947.1 4-hydroxy-3-polyprenylbenzoate decarboxylase [Rhodobaca barguzinensis]TDY68870.1 3-octaprenyl-4-hydroxybenzoate decarboxylase [Rhodobaca bogoriensis DSM 18756]